MPSYLHRTEPMELDDLPLQVALLTGEIMRMRMEIDLPALRCDLDRMKLKITVLWNAWNARKNR